MMGHDGTAKTRQDRILATGRQFRSWTYVLCV